MKTPQEKAKVIFDSFKEYTGNKIFDLNMVKRDKDAKQCALIAVQLVIDAEPTYSAGVRLLNTNYWNEVKSEIEKM